MPDDGPIGVLALQGDFAAHGRRLEELGVRWRRVRLPEDTKGLRGLILPGGESTTLLRLLRENQLDETLRQLHQQGLPLFGTCAGLILLAQRVLSPEQPSFGFLNVTVRRNAYGRQIDSFETTGEWLGGDQPRPLELVFIRAPRIVEVGPGVRVLARLASEVVAVQQGNVIGATFHPELSSDPTVHQYFLELCRHHACGLAAV